MTSSQQPIDAPDEYRNWLAGHRADVQQHRDGLLAAERTWSWGRLLSFFAAAGVWFPLDAQPFIAATLFAGLIVFFVHAVRRHGSTKRQRELEDRILTVIDESLKRCGGQVVLIRSHDRPSDPPSSVGVLAPVWEDGATWPLTGQELDDLDVYAAPVGLFGLLNRTSTFVGAVRLRDMVEHPCLQANHILARQTAVRRLNENAAEKFRIMGAVALLRGKDDFLRGFVTAVRASTPFPWPAVSKTLRVWSCCSAVLCAFALIQTGLGHYGSSYILLALLLLNGASYTRIRNQLDTLLGLWKSVTPAARGFRHAADEAALGLAELPEFSSLTTSLQSVAAEPVLPALCNRLRWVDSGGLFHILSNVFFFYDLHVVESILRCAVPHRDKLLTGLAALADVESLASLSCFASESGSESAICFPTMTSESQYHIGDGRHPLMNPSETVPNTITLNEKAKLRIITGPNMGGKSTLLRMCGVNHLLAQIGTVATAKSMSMSPMRLITDLQVRDSLAAGESYFLAEVRHLRRMLVEQNGDIPILGLIDEPFRGTNSAEQVAASVALVEHLLEVPGLFLLATHEKSLTDLAEESPQAANFHFQERLEGAALTFDYILRPGPAQSRNALRVLEREGYPKALLDRAEQWLRDNGQT